MRFVCAFVCGCVCVCVAVQLWGFNFNPLTAYWHFVALSCEFTSYLLCYWRCCCCCHYVCCCCCSWNSSNFFCKHCLCCCAGHISLSAICRSHRTMDSTANWTLSGHWFAAVAVVIAMLPATTRHLCFCSLCKALLRYSCLYLSHSSSHFCAVAHSPPLFASPAHTVCTHTRSWC